MFHNEDHPLIRKLSSSVNLSGRERELIGALPWQVQAVRARQDIVRQGERPRRSFLVLDGYTGTCKTLKSGARQITAIATPGDMPDLMTLHLPVLDCGIAAFGDCRIAFVEHEALHALMREAPGLIDVFWRETLIYSALEREWLVNLGQRHGMQRLAHLFCEVLTRMEAVGQVQNGRCPFPVTQNDLGEALGFTSVHVNRILAELRATGHAELRAGMLDVFNRKGLADVAGFDPGYLHIRVPPAS